MTEKESIYKELLKKSPLTAKGILEKRGVTIPPSMIKGKINPDYIKIVSKFVQNNLYEKQDQRLTLCKEGKIFRLYRDDKLSYGKIADSKTYRISAKDFLNEIWKIEWGKKVHSYYFATPLTYKWMIILDKVIKEVEKRLDIFLGKERIDEIKDTFKKLIESMQKVELFPKNKKIKSKNLFYKSFSEKEFKEVKKKMFGFDIIEHDFSRHFSRHLSHKIITNKIFISLFHELMHYQEKLHRLIFVNPKIEIENILEVI